MIDTTPPLLDGTAASHAQRLRWVAVALLSTSVAWAVASELAAPGTGFAVIMLSFALVGAFLMHRVPGNRVGSVLAGIGFLTCTGAASAEVAAALALSGRAGAPVVALAWYGEWYWVPFLYLEFIAFPLLLPSGHATSPRTVLRIAAIACVVATAAAMFQRDLLTEELPRPLPNPVGFLPYGDVDLTVIVLLIVASIVALGAIAATQLLRRFRRATGVEQQQLKAIVFGVLVNVVGFVLFGVLNGVIRLPAWIEWLRLVFLATVPLSVLVAVTRYRLYELDRVISRTVSYSLVSAVLVGVYVVVTIVPSAVFALESDLLVAAATLVAAGAFVPVRRRVQAAVDQRFNRARYDAARVVERFGERLRDDLDLDGLRDDLREVVAVTVQPAHVSLWVPSGRSRR